MTEFEDDLDQYLAHIEKPKEQKLRKVSMKTSDQMNIVLGSRSNDIRTTAQKLVSNKQGLFQSFHREQ